MKRFFIIWNPASERPPRKQFDTEAAALEIAATMAAQYGEEFYVCEARSLSTRTAPPVTTTKLGRGR